ncbi:MAG TPA: hypothetical protein VGE00_05275 [Gammaproteobacteria bacterium]
MSDAKTQQYIAQHHTTGERILQAWQQELNRSGMSGQLPLQLWKTAHFEILLDPASGESVLKGCWRTTRGELLGSVVLHADGSFFAEYDVLRPHPHRPGWFVEAVTAWGRDAIVKSELRLLKMPE